MKIQVLRSAMEDLAAGRRFYDRQEASVGDYFFDSLFDEIAQDRQAFCPSFTILKVFNYQCGGRKALPTDLVFLIIMKTEVL